MNVGGRFRYATQPGRIDFLRWQLLTSMGEGLKVCLFCSYNQHHHVCCGRLYDVWKLHHHKEAQKRPSASTFALQCVLYAALPQGSMKAYPLTATSNKDVFAYGKHVFEHSPPALGLFIRC